MCGGSARVAASMAVEIELVEGGERPCANGPRLFCAAREGIHQRDDLMA